MKRPIKSVNVKNLSEKLSVEDVSNTPLFKDVIYEELCLAIIEGLNSRKEIVTLFELNHSGCILELKQEYWETSLKEAIKYFESKEKFEACIICRNLINKINGHTQRIKQVNSSRRQIIKRKNFNQKKKENEFPSK